MGQLSRRKGANAEREVAMLMRRVFPEAQRRVTGEEAQSNQGIDLKGTHPYTVQVKCSGKPNPIRAWMESMKGGMGKGIPIAVCRISTRKLQSPWLVTIGLQDFLDLERAARIGHETEKLSNAKPALPEAPA